MHLISRNHTGRPDSALEEVAIPVYNRADAIAVDVTALYAPLPDPVLDEESL
ncbi:hypothetical protein ACFLSW_00585 [Candidatus Bipolaricaulota bacterium]